MKLFKVHAKFEQRFSNYKTLYSTYEIRLLRIGSKLYRRARSSSLEAEPSNKANNNVKYEYV